MTPPPLTPLLLLKTRSLPSDPYFTHFSSPSSTFTPSFVPVLEHTPNEANLGRIKILLRERRLGNEFGGCIFTSQRAVEGFARVVGEVDAEEVEEEERRGNEGGNGNVGKLLAPTPTSTPFPLYVVGPATFRSLSTLLASSPLLLSLHCTILGSQSGNGEALAHFILKHYNHTFYQEYFSLYEAPRLPFVPLVGMGGDQYSRWRAGEEDVRKRGLLFLVGEQRRDVIPRVLGVGGGEVGRSINVEEVEVYSTVIREGFEGEFTRKVDELEREGEERVVIVVFSPGGCEAMLRGIGWGVEDGDDQTGENATQPKRKIDRSRFVVAAIGPTTRDYLKEKFGFEVDVTVKIPSPEGLAEGVDTFLRGIGLLAQGSGR